jgi:hypothetical protein
MGWLERGLDAQALDGKRDVPGPASEKATFRREWNFAFALVAAAAVGLMAAGHILAGVLAAVLGGGAVAARWAATRRKGRGFYD